MTIVCGLPRSGTSMMMRMLEAGGLPVLTDHIRQSNEDNPGGYYEFEPAKQTKQDSSWLAQAVGKAVKMVYRLVYDLPPNYEYCLLFMRRDIHEVLISQRKMLDRDGRVDHAPDDEMAALFRADVARFEKWLARQVNMRSLDVDYRKVVSAPAEPVAQIVEFLGGGLNAARMCQIVDVNLYRNRGGAVAQPKATT
ncbi:MAG TPA: sulfotransferase family protein [Pirellulales bacterium]|nr:sulfotransferase family protein [Pirellulales bacterium]